MSTFSISGITFSRLQFPKFQDHLSIIETTLIRWYAAIIDINYAAITAIIIVKSIPEYIIGSFFDTVQL